MRIGIIGGGGAGLASAWLLEQQHEVTLFEKETRLGGHAHTVEVELDGKRIAIDAGFEFFWDKSFPTFIKLLKLLNVPLHTYTPKVTVYSSDQRRVVVLPPFGDGKIIWSALKPAQIKRLLQLQRFLSKAAQFVEKADPFLTIDDYLKRLSLSPSFRDEFLYPYLLAQWCVELDEFKGFSAYNALKYSTANRLVGLSLPQMKEVIGGTQVYIQALARCLTRAQVRLNSTISRITHNAAYTVEEADGTRHEFDHLIIATGAVEAFGLLGEVEGCEAVRSELGRIEYFPTTIAIHGDRRLMPTQEKYWSIFNIRYDSQHSSNTIWKRWLSPRPIFKSWVTFDSQMPDPLYTSVKFEHPKINLNYYEAQRNLNTLQGQNGLWLAGLYMHDIDCHESAIKSAVKVARRLAPDSANLQKLE